MLSTHDGSGLWKHKSWWYDYATKTTLDALVSLSEMNIHGFPKSLQMYSCIHHVTNPYTFINMR
ncbi:hypothetical protein QJS10_CPB12g01002 [Acorus calamus]|uniref:Uncharacterized protein n=1 Tax=Acorus calamus TaxID=4465 RepID=A0AAV9DMA9_ACOCL|nr:hypothetical protein QJS10_CPB12g01002 [Acorus calamus]